MKNCVLCETGFLSHMAIQHLDDLCAVGRPDTMELQNFYAAYRQFCVDLGISLAPTDDPDKAFGPTTRGKLLGVMFDTKRWIWWLDEGKVHRYLNDIRDLMRSDSATMRDVKSVLGEILYMVPLIPKAELHVAELHKLNSYSDVLTDVVTIPAEVKECLEWWLAMVRLCKKGLPIPSHHSSRICPIWAVRADSDASGGSYTAGHGVGAVSAKGEWSRVLWPKAGFILGQNV